LTEPKAQVAGAATVWRICGGVRDITVRTGPALCNLTQQLQKVQSELTALLVALALVLAITVNVAETVIDTKSALTVTVLGGFWVDRVCSYMRSLTGPLMQPMPTPVLPAQLTETVLQPEPQQFTSYISLHTMSLGPMQHIMTSSSPAAGTSSHCL
jgi:hypothetical protein